MIFVSQIVLWWDLPQKIILGPYLQYSQNKAQTREKKKRFYENPDDVRALTLVYFIKKLD